jgi:ectoine hydroxylase-related dioxygenase (phytanoyl-CoA dioxygenase family)
MRLSEAQLREYDEEGFLFFPALFSALEVAVLRRDVERAQTTTGAWSVRDKGAETKAIALWTRPGNSAFDAVPGLPRLLEPTRQLLGEEPYHWHSKLMFKAARTGAGWLWHQDYGYWYHDGCPTPNMLSVMVFLDEARLDNGCLQVMVGAHKRGRTEHRSMDANTESPQMGMPPEIVAEWLRFHEVRPIVGSPGGTLFWHSNLPHSSDDNRSDHPRLALIVAYNALSNEPGAGRGHGRPVPVPPLGDDALLRGRMPA